MARGEEAEARPGYGVLIIDDERSLRFTIGEALRAEGFRVFESPTGTQGLAFLRDEEVDIVLLDQKLKESGEDGLEILKIIKHDYPEIEVVMMTGYPTIASAVEALKEGAYDYLSKPLILDELRHLMARMTERRFLRGEVTSLRERLGEELTVTELVGS